MKNIKNTKFVAVANGKKGLRIVDLNIDLM